MLLRKTNSPPPPKDSTPLRLMHFLNLQRTQTTMHRASLVSGMDWEQISHVAHALLLLHLVLPLLPLVQAYTIGRNLQDLPPIYHARSAQVLLSREAYLIIVSQTSFSLTCKTSDELKCEGRRIWQSGTNGSEAYSNHVPKFLHA
eukprot:TRINITY_DN2078_c0_g1_i1.p1 TRINITY_DN2078_c0_g1~~TRINITY_DN2078_c0_g1_i1.p1  ORF type:complete len:145 (+),score=10.33 TRINITY_DN2078_c0_g1_i1:1040-1474(+)